MDNELKHWGIPGMKWGQRKSARRQASIASKLAYRQTYEQSMRKGLNPKQNNDFETSPLSGSSLRNNPKYKTMLKNPTKVYRNRHKLTDSEIQEAIKQFETEKKLKDLSVDHLATGAKFANTALAYITVATTAYTAYNSDLGKVVRKAFANKVGKKAVK